MPKETFYDQSGMYHLCVGWQSGDTGHVQVGITTADGRPIVNHLREQHGQDPDETDTTAPDGFAAFTALWGTLDRQALNAMIRTLRKARDAAYGADA